MHTEHHAGCLRDGNCKYGYPHRYNAQPYFDDRGRFHPRRLTEEDRYVVSHSPFLLRKYKCHINVEIIRDTNVLDYLFTYVFKGPDSEHFKVISVLQQDLGITDDFELYRRSRFVSSMEAMWRIFEYPPAHKFPTVKRLPVHLKDTNWVHYSAKELQHDDYTIAPDAHLSPLERYLFRPWSLRPYKYEQFYSTYYHCPKGVLPENPQVVQDGDFDEPPFGTAQLFVRKRQRPDVVVRMRLLSPTAGNNTQQLIMSRCRYLNFLTDRSLTGELWYLRLLLKHTSPWGSWEDIMSFVDQDGNRQHCSTYQETCRRLGIITADNTEAQLALEEAKQWQSSGKQVSLH